MLTATAAMRAGAGKLCIATIASAAPYLGVSMPEAMVVGLPENDAGGFADCTIDAIREQVAIADAVVAGPGMATGEICTRIAEVLLTGAPTLALDAAMLRCLRPPERPATNTPVLLPHAGELASLLDCDEDEVAREPIACGHRAAARYGAHILVKGVTSHVVTPDGDVFTYAGGAPGLGVSGSGDILAGIVGGLLARGAEPLNALLWAVSLHGEAGAKLAKKVGPIGFLAREIADEIPALLPR